MEAGAPCTAPPGLTKKPGSKASAVQSRLAINKRLRDGSRGDSIAGRREVDGVESQTLAVAATDVVELRDLPVAEAPTGAKHGLGIDLISQAQARSNGIRVSADQIAVAAASAGAFVDYSAQAAIRIWIRDSGSKPLVRCQISRLGN